MMLDQMIVELPISGSNRPAIIDAINYQKVLDYNVNFGLAGRGYACGWSKKYKIKIYLHHIILDGKLGYDHKDGDKLNNRESNLRPATESQNLVNRKRYHKNTTSKYRGVCWDKTRDKWCAGLSRRGRRLNLGRFSSETEAATAYNKAAIKYYGDFAQLNEIMESDLT